MNEGWVCLHCGGTSKHFSISRNELVCDTCGTIFRTAEEKNADINYERAIGLAIQHLKVGNWDEARELIKPFCSSRPADKRLYSMLLFSITKGYTDFLTDNEAYRKEAYDYWDKLTRLNCIDAVMREYAVRRRKYVNEEGNILLAKKAAAIGASIMISFIAITLLGNDSQDGPCFLILAIISWFFSGRYLQRLPRNIKSFRSYNQGRDNPFL